VCNKLGSANGIAIIKEENNQGKIELSEVSYPPNGMYNLLIISQVIKSGWML
jgi:hypothetical protein